MSWMTAVSNRESIFYGRLTKKRNRFSVLRHESRSTLVMFFEDPSIEFYNTHVRIKQTSEDRLDEQEFHVLRNLRYGSIRHTHKLVRPAVPKIEY